MQQSAHFPMILTEVGPTAMQLCQKKFYKLNLGFFEKSQFESNLLCESDEDEQNRQEDYDVVVHFNDEADFNPKSEIKRTEIYQKSQMHNNA